MADPVKPIGQSGLNRPLTCANCPFANGATCVGYSGPLNSPWVIVGESPGYEEIREGIPFVGPSGRLLWSSFPLGRNPEILVTNALSCMPTQPKKSPQSVLQATRSCHTRLIQEIEKVPRQLIIALGNSAIWSLTGNYNYKITQIRGRLIPSPLASIGILPVVHPAALLRGTGNIRQFRQDLEYAASLIDLPQAQAQAQAQGNGKGLLAKLAVAPAKTFVEALLIENPSSQLYAGEGYFAADIETSGFKASVHDILCVGITVPKIPELTAGVFNIRPDNPQKMEVLQQLRQVLETPHIKWIWHNGKFDVGFLRKNGLPARVDEDTMLASYALDESRGVHDLEQVMSDLLGAPDYKHMIRPYLPNKAASYSLIPPPVLHKYTSIDVGGTQQIWPILRQKVAADPALEKLYTKVLLPASEMLTRVELKGIYVDQDKLQINIENLQQQMMEAENTLYEVAGKRFNPNSPQQVAALLYDKLKLRPKGKAKHRGTDKDVLGKMPPHPAVLALLSYRKAQKMYSTYAVGTQKALAVSSDGRVHTTFLIHGTRTGRLSSREPNLQNVPRLSYIRDMYGAPPHRRFVELDLNQAELRSLAALSGDDFLCEIYRGTNRSLHNEVAKEFFGPNYTSEQKMRAKAVNFGIVYGREPPSIAEEFGIPVKEAQGYIDSWFARAPKAHAFILRCREAATKGETIVTPFGRKKRHALVTRDNLHDLQNEAANFPHQSIASDITLLAAVDVQDELERLDVYIVNLVHDSILLDCPDDPEIAREAKMILAASMQDIPVRWGVTQVPFKAEAKEGYHWGSLEEAGIEELVSLPMKGK